MPTSRSSPIGRRSSRPTLHEIWLARADKTRPVLVLTRSAVIPFLQRITVAPITSTIKGLMSEVRVGSSNGIDRDSVVSCDNIVTIPTTTLIRRLGALHSHQERQLAEATAYALDLETDD